MVVVQVPESKFTLARDVKQKLSELGVEKISDLVYLEDCDLVEVGMTVVILQLAKCIARQQREQEKQQSLGQKRAPSLLRRPRRGRWAQPAVTVEELPAEDEARGDAWTVWQVGYWWEIVGDW